MLLTSVYFRHMRMATLCSTFNRQLKCLGPAKAKYHFYSKKNTDMFPFMDNFTKIIHSVYLFMMIRFLPDQILRDYWWTLIRLRLTKSAI